MNGITLAAEITGALSQSKPSVSNATPATKFSDVLSGKISTEVNSVGTLTTDNTEQKQTDSVEDTIAQLFEMVDSGASKEDILKLLDGMTSEQANNLFDVLKKILEVVSNLAEKSDVNSDSGKDLISVLESLISTGIASDSDDDKNVDIENSVAQEILAMLQSAKAIQTDDLKNTETVLQKQVQAIASTKSNVAVSAESTEVKPQTESKIAFEIPVSDLAQTVKATPIQTNTVETQAKIIPVETTLTQANTVETVPTESVTETIQITAPVTSTLKEVQTRLEKLIEIVGQKASEVKLAEDVKVVLKSDAVSEENVKLTAENEIKKLSLLGNKVVKNSSEFEELMASANATKTVQQTSMNDTPVKVTDVPVETQISQNIANQLSAKVTDSGTQELTMKLTPEDLGEVSIKLVKTGGAITVSIVAQNEATQKLLQERLPMLVSSLQATNSEVKDVQIVAPNQNATGFMNSFNLSDSNSQSQYNARQTQNFTASALTPTEEIEEIKEYHGEAKLWQTA